MAKNSRLSKIYINIKQRCYNPNTINYKHYGDRGITVCEEWLSKDRIISKDGLSTKGWLSFKEWALNNGYQEGLTIDRIDNNKGYSPENCRWVSRKEQQNNLRSNHLITYKGKTQTMAQWSEELGIDYRTIVTRVATLKWPIKKAFETSVKKRCRKGECK